jgi:hypothetical protein
VLRDVETNQPNFKTLKKFWIHSKFVTLDG